ncbi:chromosomal replication initiation ATPase DnaA [Pseudochelatococcus lubricantis]|uniref:Chromosomal replication initiation ATPase DnaA n=1 Tax=Pseudochelatococcus lubricantis TaxID=1538102 RepID=A0ABX0UY28_9HYPH|nr:helix-turn-helix domain-containing protein [Pseudochelatococcus lubricantis]NIJ57194.1 chromosomal replication initiation ATPase DnaA [Pseudochelatococcus lubricantis]
MDDRSGELARLSPACSEAAIAAYRDGVPVSVIAPALHVSAYTIDCVVRKARIEMLRERTAIVKHHAEMLDRAFEAEHQSNIWTAPPRAKEIVREVSVKFRVPLSSILRKHRHGNVARAAQMAMYRLAQEGRWSNPQIGSFLGGRDPSTVFYGVRRIKSLIEKGEVAV